MSIHVCWWCQGELVWDSDADADDYYCVEGVDGICTFLHCSQCNAMITYEPSPEWQYCDQSPSTGVDNE